MKYRVSDYDLPNGHRYLKSEQFDKEGLKWRYEAWYKTTKDHEPYKSKIWQREA